MIALSGAILPSWCPPGYVPVYLAPALILDWVQEGYIDKGKISGELTPSAVAEMLGSYFGQSLSYGGISAAGVPTSTEEGLLELAPAVWRMERAGPYPLPDRID